MAERCVVCAEQDRLPKGWDKILIPGTNQLVLYAGLTAVQRSRNPTGPLAMERRKCWDQMASQEGTVVFLHPAAKRESSE
jgi:hypothetical protein